MRVGRTAGPRRWLLWLGVAAVGGLVGGLLTWAAALGPALRQDRLAAANAASPAVAVFRRVSPAVVLVASLGSVATPLGPRPQVGWGSGVIFDPRGYIVTNDHVVAGATRLRVTLANGRTLPAVLVGGDPATDLAVVRVEAGAPLPVAHFAPAASVFPGETAVAIGNPLGPAFAQSVTQGVVSAVRPMLYGLDARDRRVTEMIQTDAAINPGNSGGPLCDAAGLVIGINTIQVPQAGPGIAASGLGFAIPAETVRRVAEDLVRYGHVRRAWLGVDLAVSPADALPGEAQTVTITGVVPGSPAQRAGLQVGDRILAWDGRALHGYYELVLRINAATPGERVSLTIARSPPGAAPEGAGAAGQPQTVAVRLGTAPAGPGTA